MATVGDPETPEDVFYLCFLRLLLIQPRRSAAITIRTNNGYKLTLLLRWWWWWLQATRPAPSSPSFLWRQIQYPFHWLSSFSVISDLFLNWSYKLFHILISARWIRPRFLSSLLLFPIYFKCLDYKANQAIWFCHSVSTQRNWLSAQLPPRAL